MTHPIPSFETTYAVPLHCAACLTAIRTALSPLPGITAVSGSVSSQLISVTGSAAPSAIVAAIQGTGRDAILRGSGRTDGAAVCILETFAEGLSRGEGEGEGGAQGRVKGLVRIVQVADGICVFDVAVRGVAEGEYEVWIARKGDVSRGAESVGELWDDAPSSGARGKASERGEEEGRGREGKRGFLGVLPVQGSRTASMFVDKEMEVWEIVGRSVVVSRRGKERLAREDEDELVGVIARSAGVWENDKTVCSCSGKTVWEEREGEVGRGML